MKDSISIFTILLLVSALVWQVFNPPESPTQEQLDTVNKLLINCREEKSSLENTISQLNNSVVLAEAAREAAEKRANEAEGKVDGLNRRLSKKREELAAAVKSRNELLGLRDQLIEVNKRYEERLAMLAKLKRAGTATADRELDKLLLQDEQGFLVLGDDL